MSPRETVFWYSAAFVTYVFASLQELALQNWIVGPLWLVAFVVGGPILTDALRGRR
jgi:hypothetical protein